MRTKWRISCITRRGRWKYSSIIFLFLYPFGSSGTHDRQNNNDNKNNNHVQGGHDNNVVRELVVNKLMVEQRRESIGQNEKVIWEQKSGTMGHARRKVWWWSFLFQTKKNGKLRKRKPEFRWLRKEEGEESRLGQSEELVLGTKDEIVTVG